MKIPLEHFALRLEHSSFKYILKIIGELKSSCFKPMLHGMEWDSFVSILIWAFILEFIDTSILKNFPDIPFLFRQERSL